MTAPTAIERLLRQDRLIVIAALVALCLLAWGYLLIGVHAGMDALSMARVSLFPHLDPILGAMAMMEAPSAAWPPAYWAIMLAMWWIMMIAMMVPSAAPTILLYARVHRHGQSSGAIAGAVAPTGAFAAGYLFTWFGFALAAAALHWAFERAGLISPMMMGSQNRWFSAALLFSAGLYQFSPLKEACLSHCRSPAEFISRHWSAQPFGALTMGVRHGAYCVGCCWMLMALLFVGGVMNLVWIAALAVLVLVEKLLPLGRWAGRVSGAILLVWGAATMMV